MFPAESFAVNDKRVRWGTTIVQAAELLNASFKTQPYNGWSDLVIPGTEILGLKCTEINLRAPADSLILQVNYNLAPVITVSESDLHSTYLNHLVRVLGEPTKTEDLYNSRMYNGKITSGSVVYVAKWETETVRLGLSVYGGIRDEATNPYAAGIYIDWLDEVSAAQPQLQLLAETLRELQVGYHQITDIRKFSVTWPIRKYFVEHYANTNPREAESNDDVRAAQLALYKKNAIVTPEFVSADLDERDIKVFRLNNKVLMSTKWDTTFLSPGDESSIVFTQLHPARGSGCRMLDVNGISLIDESRGNALLDVANWLSRLSGNKIEMQEGYDE